MSHQLDTEEINNLRTDYATKKSHVIAERAAARNGVLAASYDARAKAKLNRTFSIEVETGSVTNQWHSGRCWLFSTLNTLRHEFARQYKVKDFELSQAYLYFWDKIERANMFYEKILATADRPTDDRVVSYYLNELGGPAGDGGQWAMAAALIQKYGVIPSYAFPESFNTNDTSGFADALNLKLRHDAKTLRNLKTQQASSTKIAAKRHDLLKEVYRMTAIAVGEPPVSFDLEFKDDDNHYHLNKDLTPKTFLQKYFTMNLDDYVVLTNSPEKPLHQLYSLPSQNNIVGGKEIKLLNTEMKDLAAAAIAQLKDGLTVWFGNDVTKQSERKEGILDPQLYRLDELFDVDLSMTKAERLEYGEAEVSHAMTLTGVDLDDQNIRQWKVENSWGEKNGEKGYFVMSNDWFNEFTYEVVINKKYLSTDLQNLAATTPTELAPWDSLA